jgi:hypothetical protein
MVRDRRGPLNRSDEPSSPGLEREVLRSWLLIKCFSYDGGASGHDARRAWQEARRVFSGQAERALETYVKERGLSAPDLKAIARDRDGWGEWVIGSPQFVAAVLPEGPGEEPDWRLAGVDPVDAFHAAALMRDCDSWRGEPCRQDKRLARREAQMVLGFRAERALEVYMKEHGLSTPDLEAVARDGAALDDLLAHIKAAQRPGFEPMLRPGARQTLQARMRSGMPPETLLVMAEYGVQEPIWGLPLGGNLVDLDRLGVSGSLIRALRAWNDTYEDAPNDQDWPAWVQQGLTLAHELQAELPGLDVRYWHLDDDRTLRDIRQF